MKKNNGQFAVGNAGGPGRPRRAVELDYLAALSEALPLETWRQICERAVNDASAGDDKARAWLAKYVIGESSSLFELAKLEAHGITAADFVAAVADSETERQGGGDAQLLESLTGIETLYARARRLKEASSSTS